MIQKKRRERRSASPLRRSRHLVRTLVCVGGLGAAPALAGDPLTSAGDVLQYALPVAAAVCAAHQHRLESYAAGFVALTATVQGLKHGLGNASINERPNGGSQGFPSGHTAAAASGATDLALNCAPGNRLVAAAGGAATAIVGASRIEANEHDLLQVLAGAALGFFSTGITVTHPPGGGFGLAYRISLP